MKWCSQFFFLSLLVCIYGAPSSFDKVDAAQTVDTCTSVISLYGVQGLPVIDCVESPQTNATFWRLDVKLTWTLARAACRSAGNADLATVSNFNDQNILNDLYTAKVLLNTWMWIGIVRDANGTLQWNDGSEIYPLRWYPFPDSRTNGDCAVMLILSDPNGDKDVAGTFYYTEDCANEYIAACKAVVYPPPPPPLPQPVNVGEHII